MKKFILVALLVGGALASVATIYYMFFFDIGIAARQYETHRQELKKRGYFETEAEFRKEIGLDDSANVGPKVQELLKRVAPLARKVLDEYEGYYVLIDWPGFEKDVERIESLADAKVCTFSDSSPFDPMASGHMPELRQLGKAFSLRGQQAWIRGDHPLAFRCWSVAATVANWSDQHAMAIHALIRVSIESFVYKAMRDAINVAPVTKADQAPLEQILDRLKSRVSFEKMLRCEYWFGAQSIAKATHKELMDELETNELPQSRASWPLYKKAIQSRFVESQLALEKEIAALKAGGPLSLKALYTAGENQERFFTQPGPSYEHYKTFSAMLIGTTKSRANVDSQHAVIRQAIAVMASGDKSTKLPLPAPYQQDGFSGTLIFKKLNGKRIIYSVGMNGIDDGGEDSGVYLLKAPGSPMPKDDFGVIIP